VDLINVEDIVSVTLFDLRISESEMQYIADALSYALYSLDDKQLHKLFNEGKHSNLETPEESREFATVVFRQIMNLIKIHCREQYLQERFRNWTITEE
jgi:hypothetical protein